MFCSWPIRRRGRCTSPRARAQGLCARLRPGRRPWAAGRGAGLRRSCRRAWALPATRLSDSPCARSRPSGSRSTSSRSWGGHGSRPRGWWVGRWAPRRRWCRSKSPPTYSCRRCSHRCPCGGTNEGRKVYGRNGVPDTDVYWCIKLGIYERLDYKCFNINLIVYIIYAAMMN